MASSHDPFKAAEAYSAAFKNLSNTLEQDWDITDWTDRTLEWRFFRPLETLSPEQGWKIHISASALESSELLSKVETVLSQIRVPFKVPRRIEDIIFINSGDGGSEILGKVITVYPQDEKQACKVIESCDQVWPISQGPEVQTDLHLRPKSAVSFRYGVFGSGVAVVSSTGIYYDGLRRSDGSYIPDQRLTNGKQSTHSLQPPLESCSATPFPVHLNAPLYFNGVEYLPLIKLNNTPRARTFLAANINTLETVVLKVCRSGVAGDLEGRDICSLLYSEFNILQALESITDLAPHALHWFDGEWPTLIMQDFRGSSLSQLPRSKRIEALPLIADAVAQLHDAGFVHGDIKLENAVLRNSRVGLIDFELASRKGEQMCSGGTRGYRPPEINSSNYLAHDSRDVFSLAGCVVQAVLDLPLGLMPTGIERLHGLLRNEQLLFVSNLITNWLTVDPVHRPTARLCAAELHSNILGLKSFHTKVSRAVKLIIVGSDVLVRNRRDLSMVLQKLTNRVYVGETHISCVRSSVKVSISVQPELYLG